MKRSMMLILFCLAGLVRAQSASDVSWSRTWGSVGLNEAFGVEETRDGGFIVGGHTQVNSAGYLDFCLMKTDAQGNVQWQKSFGGLSNDMGRCVKQTPDDGYIITGRTQSYGAGIDDVWVIKTDAQGEVEWKKTYGANLWDIGFDLHVLPEGGYLISGEAWVGPSANNSTGHGLFMKIKENGDLEWWREIGGSHREVFFAHTPVSDGNCVGTGFTMTKGETYGSRDNYLVKIDLDGNVIWEKAIDGQHGEDWARDIVETDDGGLLITSACKTPDESRFSLGVIKTDGEGNLIWKKMFGENESAWGRAIVKCDDGGFVVSGKIGPNVDGTRTDCILIKVDAEGKELWRKRWGESGTPTEEAITIMPVSDGGLIVAGSRKLSDSRSEILLLKYEAASLAAVSQTMAPRSSELLGNYPNPFNPQTQVAFRLQQPETVTLEVFSTAGRLMARPLAGERREAGRHEVTLACQDWPSGTYLYRVMTPSLIAHGKMTLVK